MKPFVFATAISFILSGCVSGTPPQLEAATFNAGLAPQDVAYTDARVSLVMDRLAGTSADVLCVQEVWRSDDWRRLTEATADTLPFTVRHEPAPAAVGCKTEELTPLKACAERACGELEGDELAGCALGSCGGEIGALSSGCASCVIEQVNGGAGIDELAASCTDPGSSGGGYIYGGAFGSGLLSSVPIAEQTSLALDSYLVRAAVDYAKLEAPDGDVHAFCTHLASRISQFEYEGEHESWKSEQNRQIDQLLGFVEDKAGVEPVLLMGDLNTGPAVEANGIEAKWPGHYARFDNAGFIDPYLAEPDAACTICPDNSFREASRRPTMNDHILLRGNWGGASCRRFMTELGSVTTDGMEIRTHPSDHYGLSCSLGMGD